MRKKTPPRLRLQPRRPRGRPKTGDVEALESRLAAVARQAFVLNGYGATSMNAIAKSARVSKNTLYTRFPSKASLFQLIVAGQIASVIEELPSAFEEHAESLGDQLRAYVDLALRKSLSKDVLEINRLIMGESYQFPELGEAARARFQTGIQRVAHLIKVHAERDRIPCRSATAAAEVFMYSVYGWYTFVVVTGRPVTDRERTAWVGNAVSAFLASRSTW